MTRFDSRGLLAEFHCNAPARRIEIDRFQGESGLELPEDFVQFLLKSDGGRGFIGDARAPLIIWRIGELLDLNKAYEVEDYAPGLVLFGSDGGGDAFAFDMRDPAMPIVAVPFVGMDFSLVKPIAASFDLFLEELARDYI